MATKSAAAPQTAPLATGLWGWKLGLLLLLVLLVAAGVGWLIWRRRARAAKAPTTASLGALSAVWQRFLRGLPLSARPQVPHFPWVVTLGEAGAGKSQLIDAKVDWKAQAGQFFPSYTADPVLQLYLGSRVVVHELSAPLLQSSSATTQAALQRLWQPLCEVRPPLAVVVVSLRSLEYATVEQIEQQAQCLRGKLKLLSELCSRPVRVRVVLTHAEHIAGLIELGRFLRQNQVPLEVDLTRLGPAYDDLARALQRYKKYLPLALVSLPTASYRSLVACLTGLAEPMTKPVALLRTLGEPGSTDAQPVLERLYFSDVGAELLRANPFVAEGGPPPPRLSLGVRDPATFWRALLRPLNLAALRRHLVVCTVLLAVWLGLCTLVYTHHRRVVQQAHTAVATLSEAVGRAEGSLNPPLLSTAVKLAAEDAGRRLQQLQQSESRWPLLPSVLEAEKQRARDDFTAALRRGYWLPLLNQHHDLKHVTYTLAVLYGGPQGTLGALVRAQLLDFSAVLGVSDRIVADYLKFNDPATLEALPSALQPVPVPASALASDVQPWQVYFRRLKEVMDSGALTATDLARLRTAAEPLLGVLQQISDNQLAGTIVRTLSEETKLDVPRLLGRSLDILLPPAWLLEGQAPLRATLQMVRDGSIETVAADKLSLSQFMAVLNAKPEAGKPTTGPIYQFTVGTQPFSFNQARWLELLRDSRRRNLLGSIPGAGAQRKPGGARRSHHRSGHGRSGRKAQQPSAAPDPEPAIGLPTRHPASVGTSPATLSSVYCRAAFERDIKPSLLAFDKTLAEGNLTPAQQTALQSYVTKQTRSYAKRYRESLMAFYLSYQLRGSSPATVRAALQEMNQPASSFVEHLRTVADNANLGDLSTPYLFPLAENLAPFQPIVKLMTLKDGAYPELEKYRTTLLQLAEQLDGGAAPARGVLGSAPAAAASAPTAAASAPAAAAVDPALTAVLSGFGRVALAMLLQLDSSPLKQIEPWLDTVGLPADMRPPFLSPMQRVLQVGTPEIERVLTEQWQLEVGRSLTPLYSRFPFLRTATTETELAALQPLHPKDGALWRFVQRYVSPFCSENPDGTRVAKPMAAGPFNLPPDMLSTLNRVARLSRALWNDQGERQPLLLRIKPLPLPVVGTADYVVTQSSLLAGKAAVSGFNQMPVESTFALTWWNQENAAVGIDVSRASDSKKWHYSVAQSDTIWSFYRLLTKAKLSATSVATWSVAADQLGAPVVVSFAFGEDPWALFDLQTPRAQK